MRQETNAKNFTTAASLADIPPPMMPTQNPFQAGQACRQSSKSLLLDHADRLRRKANQLEALAYAVEHIHGDAENTLHGLLSGDLYR